MIIQPKIVAKFEEQISHGDWTTIAWVRKDWRGKFPETAVKKTLSHLIEAGRVETNGKSTRGRKFRMTAEVAATFPPKAAPAPPVHANAVKAPAITITPAKPAESFSDALIEPEQPIVMAIYKDHVEMPLSSVAQLLERIS